VFRLLKDAIIDIKDGGTVLLRTAELKQRLEMVLPGEPFTADELRSVVGLLTGPGVVWNLEFGDFVLLQPERINAYAAAVVRTVRAHSDEIGAIPESRVLAGGLDFGDMRRLDHADEQIVLRAMYQTFVERGLCLREHTDAGPQTRRRHPRPTGAGTYVHRARPGAIRWQSAQGGGGAEHQHGHALAPDEAVRPVVLTPVSS
jgi:hypothetical protein